MSGVDPFALGGRQEDDVALLVAERELYECLARAHAQREADPSDGCLESLWDEVGSRAAMIFNTPPSSLIGAAVKLRILLHPELGIEEDAQSENVVALRQLLAYVEKGD